MSSNKKNQKTSWKDLLLKAKQLDRRVMANLYERTSLLVRIFDDAEFRADVGARDDHQAADWLDAEMNADVGLNFLQLRAIFLEFPKQHAWQDTTLRELYAQLRPAEPADKPPKKRTAVKLADFKRACEDRDNYRAQVESLNEQVASLKKERDEHRREIAHLLGRIEELEKSSTAALAAA